MSEAILDVKNLTVAYEGGGRSSRALNDISFRIERGKVLGIVGESGSGKSTAAMAVLGLLPGGAKPSGQVLFKGQDIYAKSPEERRALRGREISIVFQDPFTSLNPSIQVGRQIAEPLILHKGMEEKAALQEAENLLREVGITDPARTAKAYPHQLSGGMKQRALIATALACDPELMILDEPTTALDVTIEAQILDLLEALRVKRNLSMMFISHNLGVIARLADEVCVLYAGDVVEYGPKETVLGPGHRHPYTKGLLASLPKLTDRRDRLFPIPGRLPDLSQTIPGCIFEARCPFACKGCGQPQPLQAVGADHVSRCWRSLELADVPWRADDAEGGVAAHSTREHQPGGEMLLEARDVVKRFTVVSGLPALKFDASGGGFPLRYEPVSLRAVDRVTLSIRQGETVGLVGESGCGKSTFGRCLIRLIEPQGGEVLLRGEDILSASPGRHRALMQEAQIIFQNPDSSLNPRKTVREILARPIRLFGIAEGAEVDRKVDELLDMVRLSPRYASRYPHQMSGGEKQRVGIARALASKPKFIVCDEAVSALDVSVQASILNLLADLRDELNVAYLFISHDLSVISHIADRICVMYRGGIVELGPTERILQPPYHPYTEALLSAVPFIEKGARQRERIRLAGSVTGSTEQIVGCRFQDRCPRKLGGICETVTPPARSSAEGHEILCHIPLEELSGYESVLEPLERRA
ncbi:dipeptide ABC transporter ATP-binding protein [Oceanibaculum pacificum]|uniref:ABC transporter domain-containing protein n=1 Tax=Oceanibaculum pacificum TaxID=580166 RepID=A0A154W7J0_9PROT|nr:ABC transporter ATP-binding protein [Oceanibaculum pacificum]KZD09499.1 hypothetical protein AUP43_07075 [Oceanibaculum pacificum]